MCTTELTVLHIPNVDSPENSPRVAPRTALSHHILYNAFEFDINFEPNMTQNPKK